MFTNKGVVFIFGLFAFVSIFSFCSFCDVNSSWNYNDIETLETFLSEYEPSTMMTSETIEKQKIRLIIMPSQINETGTYKVEVMFKGLKGVLEFRIRKGHCIYKHIKIYSEETLLDDIIMTYE